MGSLIKKALHVSFHPSFPVSPFLPGDTLIAAHSSQHTHGLPKQDLLLSLGSHLFVFLSSPKKGRKCASCLEKDAKGT